jgi:probable HAF family extracellular repeat protein
MIPRLCSKALLTALTTAAFAVTGAVAAPVYSIQKIAKPDGLVAMEADGISDTGGFIVGHGPNDGNTSITGAYISQHRQSTPLYQPCTRTVCTTWAMGVNTQGEAVGTTFGDKVHAYHWDAAGLGTDLDALIPCETSTKDTRGVAINNAGSSLVNLQCIDGNHEWRYQPYVVQGSTATPVGSLGGARTAGFGLNNLGQVVGWSELPPDDQGKVYEHAFLWSHGETKDLGTFGGGKNSHARAINDLGHIALTSNNEQGKDRSYIHDGTTVRQITGCGVGDLLHPVAINNRDDVALATIGGHASYLYKGHTCYPLADLLDASGDGWTALDVKDMDEAGVLVGYGYYKGHLRGFVAKPVKP